MMMVVGLWSLTKGVKTSENRWFGRRLVVTVRGRRSMGGRGSAGEEGGEGGACGYVKRRRGERNWEPQSGSRPRRRRREEEQCKMSQARQTDRGFFGSSFLVHCDQRRTTHLHLHLVAQRQERPLLKIFFRRSWTGDRELRRFMRYLKVREAECRCREQTGQFWLISFHVLRQLTSRGWDSRHRRI